MFMAVPSLISSLGYAPGGRIFRAALMTRLNLLLATQRLMSFVDEFLNGGQAVPPAYSCDFLSGLADDENVSFVVLCSYFWRHVGACAKSDGHTREWNLPVLKHTDTSGG